MWMAFWSMGGPKMDVSGIHLFENDFGFSSYTLHEQFFVPYWENIVVGRAGLMEHLTTALQKIARHVSPARFVSYWFERDSRLVTSLLPVLSVVRSEGIRVYPASNQEHLRAAYLMENLGLVTFPPENDGS